MMERDIEQEAIIMQQALRLNAPLPDKIANIPDLSPGLEFYLEAYLDLSSDKSVGFGEGPIPWSSLNEYAKRYNIVEEEFERMISVIQGTDNQVLIHKNKKQKRDAKKK